MLELSAALVTTALLGGRRYIDPGSGSFVIQIIIAAVLGGILSARLWLRHVFWRIIGRGRWTKTDDQASAEVTNRQCRPTPARRRGPIAQRSEQTAHNR